MILLSAGHYPEKPGAHFEDFYEFDEASRWVDKIISVVNDERLLKVPHATLKSKVAFINARSAKLAVEIHFNSALNASGEHVGNGALVLHNPGSKIGAQYADLFFQTLEPIFGKHWEGVMEGWYRMDKKYGPNFFLARTNCPAIILEPEFIHHKEIILGYREVACNNLAEAIKSLL